ncbi:unnamed protein product [Durusdinium trenchii]|uniref:Uncharacterized protein n=2 Tax=Durusdinium trenchii TaxID=1381693 RepID=A0ABP0K028_9DINO
MSMAQPVIFLDVDGVLHPGTYEAHRCQDLFRSQCLTELRRIIDATNAILVLSSSWRESPGACRRLKKVLEEHGMSLFGSTEVSGCPGLRGRGLEINRWLRSHAQHVQIPYWLALDDLDLAKEGGLVPREHLVRTNTQFGLRPDDADAAIARLSVQVCSCEVCQAYAE